MKRWLRKRGIFVSTDTWTACPEPPGKAWQTPACVAGLRGQGQARRPGPRPVEAGPAPVRPVSLAQAQRGAEEPMPRGHALCSLCPGPRGERMGPGGRGQVGPSVLREHRQVDRRRGAGGVARSRGGGGLPAGPARRRGRHKTLSCPVTQGELGHCPRPRAFSGRTLAGWSAFVLHDPSVQQRRLPSEAGPRGSRFQGPAGGREAARSVARTPTGTEIPRTRLILCRPPPFPPPALSLSLCSARPAGPRPCPCSPGSARRVAKGRSERFRGARHPIPGSSNAHSRSLGATVMSPE